MGLSIDSGEFSESDFIAFSEKLEQNMAALRESVKRPGFGELDKSQRKIGCELELYLVDEFGLPVYKNQEIESRVNDPLLTLELNRYNLEYNLTPVGVQNRPLDAIAKEMRNALFGINQSAQHFGCSALPIGILPTLREEDVGLHSMTDQPRYHAITQQLRKLRGGPFEINIDGASPIQMTMEDVTLEGANTSFQIHYQVAAEEFVDTYNALQLVTPLAVALCANSPMLMGHELWQETRIPLFKQSIDCRKSDPLKPTPARVNFGHAWLRHSPLELFEEAVRLYSPILPICAEECPNEALKSGRLPKLMEMKLQQGTVWLWNRPVYDEHGSGHIRIEMRALPAGPTIPDMIANLVLIIGLTEVLKPSINDLLPAIPFEYCNRNFYRAAQLGLDADLIWPEKIQSKPVYQSCKEVLKSLLPLIPEKLEEIGLNSEEFKPYMHILQSRLETGQTGSQWMLKKYAAFKSEYPEAEALSQLVQAYRKQCYANKPVSEWPI